MGRKLDRLKSFGSVYGEADHRYEQDGYLFDAEGNEVGASVKEVKTKGRKAVAADAPAGESAPPDAPIEDVQPENDDPLLA
jgi:hypothetical protein